LRGPRGLIRVGVISPTTGKPELLNYIAVEPVSRPGSRSSRMAFSELEPSRLDLDEHRAGERKRLWSDLSSYDRPIAAGTLKHFPVNGIARDRTPQCCRSTFERFSANTRTFT